MIFTSSTDVNHCDSSRSLIKNASLQSKQNPTKATKYKYAWLQQNTSTRKEILNVDSRIEKVKQCLVIMLPVRLQTSSKTVKILCGYLVVV